MAKQLSHLDKDNKKRNMSTKTFSIIEKDLDKGNTKTLLLEMLSHTIEFYELNQFGAQIRNDQKNPINEQKLLQLKKAVSEVQNYLDNESDRNFNVSIQINID
jgi:hypothetical protein